MTRLTTLLDRAALEELRPAGFRAGVDPWIEAAQHLAELGNDGSTEARAFFVPGRIEVLGKHTDYAGGRSLVAATEQGFHLAVTARGDTELRLHDLGRRRHATLDLASALAPRTGHWTNYSLTVARRLRTDFALDLAGADMAFKSTLPAAAGMSSSSALVVATWMALAASDPAGGIEETAAFRRAIRTREELAGYLGAVEAGRPFGDLPGGSLGDGVGTFGGSEDHTAILCSRAGSLSQYSYAPVRHERTIELPAGYTFAIGVSGVHASKAGSARDDYNRASLQAAELAKLWRRETGGTEPHLGAILGSDPGAHGRLEQMIQAAESGPFSAKDLGRRLAHFAAESDEILPAASDALAAGDLEAFGASTDRSQRLAESLLANQVPETSFLARSARELGARGASAFGAGFGGAVWALVESARLDDFLERWGTAFRTRFPERARVARFAGSHPGPAALELAAPL